MNAHDEAWRVPIFLAPDLPEHPDDDDERPGAPRMSPARHPATEGTP